MVDPKQSNGLIVVKGSSIEQVLQTPKVETLGDRIKAALGEMNDLNHIEEAELERQLMVTINRIKRVRNNALRQGGGS